MKTILIIIVALIIIAGGWYLISPAFRVEERDDPFPKPELMFKDMLENMTPEVKEQFEKEVEAMEDKKVRHHQQAGGLMSRTAPRAVTPDQGLVS